MSEQRVRKQTIKNQDSTRTQTTYYTITINMIEQIKEVCFNVYILLPVKGRSY